MKKVIIRADSNKIVAMGHVMRCLSVADALKKNGAEVIFVCASDDPKELIEKRGYEIKVLNSDFSQMESELTDICPILEQIKPDIIILDTYYLTDKYVESIKRYGKTVFIDDYGKDAFSVDIIINYNIYGDLMDYKGLYEKEGKACPELLPGPDYAPLRSAFLDANPIKIKEKGPYEVLVSTGGSDSLSIAKGVADLFLSDIGNRENMKLNILVGPFSKDREYLYRLGESNPDCIKIWSNITDMPGFLANFDLALSAAGSTSYELCCMGIPTSLFCMADNQSLINETFDKKGIYKSSGNAEKDREAVISNLLSFANNALTDYRYRVECSMRARDLVDARGAERIALKLL